MTSAVILAFALVFTLGCGGGNSPKSNTPPIAITAATTTATLNVGGSTTFSATVSNADVTTVTWSVQEGAAGGTITSAGVYTAPATPGTYHVIATAQANATKSVTIAVTVLPQVSVLLTPGTVTVGPALSQTFTATVSNSTGSTAVTWSVQETSGGTVTSTGVYTSPTTEGTYHVVAISVADVTKSAIATVTVARPDPVFSSSPPTSAAEGSAYTYSIVATDPANTAITYQLTTGPTGASLSGSTLTWTPSSAQSRTACAFTVTATTATGGSATQSWSVTPLGTIRGTRIITYVGDSATVMAPASDLATSTIAAHVPDGSGGFVTIAGTADAGGNFTIPGVPAGPFWLQVGKTYVWTSSSTVDLGYNSLGRPDAVADDFASGTMVSFSLTGLVPWIQEDIVELVAPNANAYRFFQGEFSLLNGATTLTSTVPYAGGYHLPDASRGDQTYVTQLSTVPGPGAGFQSLKKVLGPLSVTMLLGGTTTISGAMADVPQTNIFRGNFKGSEFMALAAAAGSVASVFGSAVNVGVQPGAERGMFGPQPDLLINLPASDNYNPTPYYFATDVDLGDIPYGNPYSSAWTPFFSYSHIVEVTWKAPGATTSRSILGSIDVASTTFPTASSPIQPIVGAPVNSTINGASLLTDQGGVGLTPQLSWEAPALGLAAGYRIQVYGISKSGTGATVITRAIAFLYTTATTITLPPGLLQAGASYGIEIDAVSSTGVDYSVNPTYQKFPFGSAPVFSGVITP